jgi:hypothetical protein
MKKRKWIWIGLAVILMEVYGQIDNFNQGWNTVEIDLTISNETGYFHANNNTVV